MKYSLKTVTFHVAESGQSVSQPEEAEPILRAIFATLDGDREHFVLLGLDSKNRARGFKVCHTGTASQAVVSPATVFRDALALGAVAVIVAHNHPSGDSTPSPEDRALTHRLCSAGESIDVPVRDHLVLGTGRAFSFRREGLM